MNKSLLTQSLLKFTSGIVLVGLMLFLPAGSFAYWQGWLLMGILFVPMAIAGAVMLAKSPELLRKRLNAKEKENEQKTVVALSGLLFIMSFTTAGLNWRYGWWMLPDWTVWTAAALFLSTASALISIFSSLQPLSKSSFDIVIISSRKFIF